MYSIFSCFFLIVAFLYLIPTFPEDYAIPSVTPKYPLLDITCPRLLSLVTWQIGSHPSSDDLHPPVVPLELRRRSLFNVNPFRFGSGPYAEYPDADAVVKTSCVIDVVQATTYLGYAALNIYRAEICPDSEPLGCTAPVAHTITSFIWLASFLTSAASTCAKSVVNGGSCAAGILRDLATAGSTIYGFDEDCYLTNPRDTSWRVFQRWWRPLVHPKAPRRLRSKGSEFEEIDQASRGNFSTYRAKSADVAARLRNLTSPEEGGRAVLPNVLFNAEARGLPRDLLSTLQKVKVVDGKHKYKTERNLPVFQCFLKEFQFP